jgi:hypothetical protein
VEGFIALLMMHVQQGALLVDFLEVVFFSALCNIAAKLVVDVTVTLHIL